MMSWLREKFPKVHWEFIGSNLHLISLTPTLYHASGGKSCRYVLDLLDDTGNEIEYRKYPYEVVNWKMVNLANPSVFDEIAAHLRQHVASISEKEDEHEL